ncbi:hypothetical protein CK203_079543 [Vitis vinifera]|uniref:DUF4283 domain-containing protein n=1 Tax=Vitis vinifera TaxID=29760 RepID=A0A438CNZ8_VITVI|nr:hypothetical protein CK203_079543 [Vitis vinifera]
MARAGICECQEKVQDWTHEGKTIARMMGKTFSERKPVLLRKWLPKENMVVHGKFRRAGEGNEGGKGNFEAGGLDEGEAGGWRCFQISFYQRCLRWKMGLDLYSSSSVIGEDDEDDVVTSETTCSRNEWVKTGGCVSQSSKFAKRATRAQIGMRIRGLQAGPKASQAHQIAALRLLLPSELCPGDERVGVEAISGVEGGTKSFGMEIWSRREENEARNGKAPAGHRSSSEPLFLRGSSSSSEVRNMEEEFGTRFQMERGIGENPLFRCQLARHCNFSREDTSAFREEDKEGLTDDGVRSSWLFRHGFTFNSIIRGKGLIFEGICEIPGAKNLEVCQPSPSQPPESSSFPSCSLDSPLSSPSGPHLPNLVPLSQSPY